jgi:hypothetical protein
MAYFFITAAFNTLNIPVVGINIIANIIVNGITTSVTTSITTRITTSVTTSVTTTTISFDVAHIARISSAGGGGLSIPLNRPNTHITCVGVGGSKFGHSGGRGGSDGTSGKGV